jgi:hypothetical protein
MTPWARIADDLDGRDQAAHDGPRLAIHSVKSLGIAATISAGLVAVLITVSLVSLHGPAKEAQAFPHCHPEVG